MRIKEEKGGSLKLKGHHLANNLETIRCKM